MWKDGASWPPAGVTGKPLQLTGAASTFTDKAFLSEMPAVADPGRAGRVVFRTAELSHTMHISGTHAVRLRVKTTKAGSIGVHLAGSTVIVPST